MNNWENIKEVEIEHIENERGNKVVSLYTSQEGEEMFIKKISKNY